MTAGPESPALATRRGKVILLPSGRLADLVGRRTIMLAGTLLVAVSSLAGGLAGNSGVFVASRLAQRLGAALMLPATFRTSISPRPAPLRGSR